jgi:hypothetical protein
MSRMGGMGVPVGVRRFGRGGADGQDRDAREG